LVKEKERRNELIILLVGGNNLSQNENEENEIKCDIKGDEDDRMCVMTIKFFICNHNIVDC